MIDFYIPKHKWELVEKLKGLYPTSDLRFERLPKKRLMAIYITARKLGRREIVWK